MRGTFEGLGSCLLSVPGIRCGGCVAAIERALAGRSDVVSARANLTLRRVGVTLPTADTDPKADPRGAGRPRLSGRADRPAGGRVAPTAVRGPACCGRLAVAGFGAMNVMLLSVAVWSGADGATRKTFHLVSALIAVPVVAYAGRPFFRSALSALRHGRLNMDVPIALAVLLTLALSLFETARGGEQAFFDAAVTLLFFLLVGRYLDRLMRERARSAVDGAAHGSRAKGAVRLGPTERWNTCRSTAIEPGMVAARRRRRAGARSTPGPARRVRRRPLAGDRRVAPVAVGRGDELEAGHAEPDRRDRRAWRCGRRGTPSSPR